jgi:hypothetical protein
MTDACQTLVNKRVIILILSSKTHSNKRAFTRILDVRQSLVHVVSYLKLEGRYGIHIDNDSINVRKMHQQQVVF